MSEIYILLNTLARQGYYVETEQRRDDWIAFLRDHRETWEAGATEEQAVKKLYDTIKSLFNNAAQHGVQADGANRAEN